MKYISLVILLFFMAPGCGLREREQAVEKKTNELNQKEQELVLREKSLQLKEEELANKEKLLDSTKNAPDSFFVKYPFVAGKWNVTMRCTQTTCSGFAVGDTKNEQWEITLQNSRIVAQAFSDNKLVRVYTGEHVGNIIELSTQPDNPDPLKSTKMIVRIRDFQEKEMRGEREIIRPDNCRVVYALDFTRQ